VRARVAVSSVPTCCCFKLLFLVCRRDPSFIHKSRHDPQVTTQLQIWLFETSGMPWIIKMYIKCDTE
jgi:hypothetical protein